MRAVVFGEQHVGGAAHNWHGTKSSRRPRPHRETDRAALRDPEPQLGAAAGRNRARSVRNACSALLSRHVPKMQQARFYGNLSALPGGSCQYSRTFWKAGMAGIESPSRYRMRIVLS